MSTLEKILESDIIFNYLLQFNKKDWNDIIVNLLEYTIQNIENTSPEGKRKIYDEELELDEIRNKMEAGKSGKKFVNKENKKSAYDNRKNIKNVIRKEVKKQKPKQKDEIIFFNSIDKLTEDFSSRNDKIESSYQAKLDKLTEKLSLIEGTKPKSIKRNFKK